MPQVNLTADDVFELKLLRERARKENAHSKFCKERNGFAVLTDTSREAQHALETLERILKQT